MAEPVLPLTVAEFEGLLDAYQYADWAHRVANDGGMGNTARELRDARAAVVIAYERAVAAAALGPQEQEGGDDARERVRALAVPAVADDEEHKDG